MGRFHIARERRDWDVRVARLAGLPRREAWEREPLVVALDRVEDREDARPRELEVELRREPVRAEPRREVVFCGMAFSFG